jgi:hypothetical protein
VRDGNAMAQKILADLDAKPVAQVAAPSPVAALAPA